MIITAGQQLLNKNDDSSQATITYVSDDSSQAINTYVNDDSSQATIIVIITYNNDYSSQATAEVFQRRKSKVLGSLHCSAVAHSFQGYNLITCYICKVPGKDPDIFVR